MTLASQEAMGTTTKVVGVMAETAPAYALSFEAGKPVSTNSPDTFADGIACRVPNPEAVKTIYDGAERIVRVSDREIEAAICWYYTDTHNVAEGAGAAPLAALYKVRHLF